MKVRVIGTIAGGLLGSIIGAGTGIVGGPFGAMAGASVFTVGGAVWGFSAAPDVVRTISRWRSR